MKNTLKKTIQIMLVLLLTGCSASRSSSADYNEYIGKSKEELMNENILFSEGKDGSWYLTRKDQIVEIVFENEKCSEIKTYGKTEQADEPIPLECRIVIDHANEDVYQINTCLIMNLPADLQSQYVSIILRNIDEIFGEIESICKPSMSTPDAFDMDYIGSVTSGKYTIAEADLDQVVDYFSNCTFNVDVYDLNNTPVFYTETLTPDSVEVNQ